jgi:basic amino acid/polyamine antiporter, APA family
MNGVRSSRSGYRVFPGGRTGRGPAQTKARSLRDGNDTGVQPDQAGPGARVGHVSWSLQRRLGTTDAVVLGLSAMLGTGVFAVWAPAAGAAGSWLLLAVLLAGVVAMCNAASTADLAVAHPESGGGFVYGRERLSHGAGRLAGVAFLVGKTASAAAAAGVFGAYVLPSHPLPAAILVIIAATVLNTAGVRWTARGAYALVGGTLAVLLVVVVVGLFGPQVDPVASAATPDVEPVAIRGGVIGVLTAAGLVFFAFAGYARIATLGAEVRDPDRTLHRAIAIALGVALVTYMLVAVALLVGFGSERLATEPTPLVALVDAGEASALGVIVRVGAPHWLWRSVVSCRPRSPWSARGAPRSGPTSRAASRRSCSPCSPDRWRPSHCRRAPSSSTTP